MQPIVTYQKTADKEKNRIILPRWFIKKHSKYFTLEVYEDYMILKPILKDNKEEIWKKC